MSDLTKKAEGFLNIEYVDGGMYDNVTLTAKSSGSVKVTEELNITGTLTLEADHSGTILIPAKVTCKDLVIKSLFSSNINSNDLEASQTCHITVDQASTVSLYLALSGGKITGSSNNSSTLNCWVDFGDGGLISDTVKSDHSSVYSRRGWNSPS